MFPVTAAEFTGEGTANILVNQYIPLWGCLRTILSDNGLKFCCKRSQAVHQLLGVRKKATTSSRSNCNESVERVNHTMSQMLAMVVNERQHDWDAHLPQVQFAYNNYVNAETGLTPNRVYMVRLPRPPLTGFDRTGVVVWPATTWPIATWPHRPTTGRKRPCSRTIRLHCFSHDTAETPPPSRTRCVRHLTSLSVVGRDCTTLPPPSTLV